MKNINAWFELDQKNENLFLKKIEAGSLRNKASPHMLAMPPNNRGQAKTSLDKRKQNSPHA